MNNKMFRSLRQPPDWPRDQSRSPPVLRDIG